MESSIRLVALALAVGILLVAAVGPVFADCPAGTDAEWDGSEDNQWSTEANWVNDVEPSCIKDTVCLAYEEEETGDNTCVYDYLPNAPGWHLTIFGQSPTFFTLQVTEDMFPGSLDLQNRAALDVDECIDVAGTTDLSGRVKIDVAFDLSGPVECCLGNGDVEDESAQLDVTGQVKFEFLTVSADDAPQDVRLVVDQGGTVLADETRLNAEVYTGHTARHTELELADGLIVANTFRIWAGQELSRRVSLDLDASMTVKNKTTLGVFPGAPIEEGGGRVMIDLPIGVTFDLGELYIAGPSIVKVTGVGLNDVFGQVVTSANEGASDNGCSCGTAGSCG